MAIVGLRRKRHAPASDTAATPPPVASRAPAPGDPSCPRTGLWQPCALVDRIVHAGLSFKPLDDSVRVPFFAVPGVHYRVAATDTMVVFFFPDSVALAKAIAPLDTRAHGAADRLAVAVARDAERDPLGQPAGPLLRQERAADRTPAPGHHRRRPASRSRNCPGRTAQQVEIQRQLGRSVFIPLV